MGEPARVIVFIRVGRAGDGVNEPIFMQQCNRGSALRCSRRSRAVILAFASGRNLRLNLGRLLLLALSRIFVSHTLSLPAAALHPKLLPVRAGRDPGVPLEDLAKEDWILITNGVTDLLHAA